jgi:hypothetical protein
MRKLCAAVLTFVLVVCLGHANAGGFPFDATHCPKGDWFPEVRIPQTVTNTLCKFFLARDSGNMRGAYVLLSPEFRASQSMDDFTKTFWDKARDETEEPPQRYVSNVEIRKDLYRLTFQVLGGSRGSQEDVYVKLDADSAKIAGLRIGPY